MQHNLISGYNLMDRVMAHCSAVLCAVLIIVVFTVLEQIVLIQAHQYQEEEAEYDYGLRQTETQSDGQNNDNEDLYDDEVNDVSYGDYRRQPMFDSSELLDSNEEYDSRHRNSDWLLQQVSRPESDYDSENLGMSESRSVAHKVANVDQEPRQKASSAGTDSSPANTLVTVQEANSKQGNFRWRIVAKLD